MYIIQSPLVIILKCVTKLQICDADFNNCNYSITIKNWFLSLREADKKNYCYDEVLRNSCQDKVSRNSCNDEAGLNRCYDEAGRNSCYDEAGGIGILLRILPPQVTFHISPAQSSIKPKSIRLVIGRNKHIKKRSVPNLLGQKNFWS